MKTKLHPLASLLALCSLLFALCFVTGCATGKVDDSGLIQTVLDVMVPHDFHGDLQANHDGFYFGTSVHLTIDIKGLRKVDGRWTWVSGGWKRDGFFSTGGLKLTPYAAPALISPEAKSP